MGEEMEANTCYLGIELNDSYAMVSYMQPNMEEPETVSTIAGSENYRIPTLLARRKNVAAFFPQENKNTSCIHKDFFIPIVHCDLCGFPSSPCRCIGSDYHCKREL